MKIEDICLTIEQAEELKELGFCMNDTIFSYYGVYGGYELVKNSEKKGADCCRIIPTFLNSEMLDMLPNNIIFYTLEGYSNPLLNILKISHGEMWEICYAWENLHSFIVKRILLRDALYMTLLWLYNSYYR